MKDTRRFRLTDNYKGNDTLPIIDKNRKEELMTTEVVYILNKLNDENKDYARLIKKLDKEVWDNHLEVQGVLFKHASAYERNSKEFNLIKDIAKELHCTISLMEAIDDYP